LTGARILVVEDEGIVALDIQSKLRAMGYDVPQIVSSARDAVESAQTLQPDLVLMDIQLEGDVDGVAAAERITRELQIPVVYLTAYSDRATLERAKIAHPMGYLLKPFEERDLYTTVEIALHKHVVEKEKARLEERLRQSSKMEAIGQLTAGLAHNFNNMLQGVIGNLDLAFLKAPDELIPFLEDAVFDAERAGKLLQQLMLFYRNEQGSHVHLDVKTVVEEAVALCRQTFPPDVEIVVDSAESLPPITGDSHQLRQCLINACTNAKEALIQRPGMIDRTIHIRSESVSFAAEDDVGPPEVIAGRYACVRISDNGMGMDEGTREHMFEPFFTTKHSSVPAGLGLSVVYGIIRDHGGWIDCTSGPGKGTELSIYIPSEDSRGGQDKDYETIQPETTTTKVNLASLRGDESILVVANVDRLRKILDLMLEHNGYDVLLGRDARDGIQLFRHEHEKIDLVVLGLSQPGISNQEVLNELTSIDPDAKILLVSGHPLGRSFAQGAADVLPKPFNTSQLLQAVRRNLDTGA
jgi:signal transduction histidine kinase